MTDDKFNKVRHHSKPPPRFPVGSLPLHQTCFACYRNTNTTSDTISDSKEHANNTRQNREVAPSISPHPFLTNLVPPSPAASRSSQAPLPGPERHTDVPSVISQKRISLRRSVQRTPSQRGTRRRFSGPSRRAIIILRARACLRFSMLGLGSSRAMGLGMEIRSIILISTLIGVGFWQGRRLRTRRRVGRRRS